MLPVLVIVLLVGHGVILYHVSSHVTLSAAVRDSARRSRACSAPSWSARAAGRFTPNRSRRWRPGLEERRRDQGSAAEKIARPLRSLGIREAASGAASVSIEYVPQGEFSIGADSLLCQEWR